MLHLVGRSGSDREIACAKCRVASFLRWTVFLSVNVYEGILRRAYPERYTAEASAVEGVRKAADARTHQAFSVLEGVLADKEFLLGGSKSAADIFCAMLYAWHGRRDNLPRCTALTHAIARDETIAPVWRRISTTGSP